MSPPKRLKFVDQRTSSFDRQVVQEIRTKKIHSRDGLQSSLQSRIDSFFPHTEGGFNTIPVYFTMITLRTFVPLFIFSAAAVVVRESHAFSQRLLVPGRSVPVPTSSTTTQGRRPWPSTGRRNVRSYRQHKALSIPYFSGPPADPRSSWEDVILPQQQGVSTEKDHHDRINAFDKLVMAATVLAGIVSVYGVISLTAPGSWRFFAAGGICAATSHAIPTPIDVIKTRKQVDPALDNKSFIVAARKVVNEEGMGALWAGLGPTVFGYLFEGAVKFGTYEILKPFFKTFLSGLAASTSTPLFNSQILAYILCGGAAGFAASVMLCPMEAIRIRMVSEPDFATGGWINVGYKILKQEGVGGLIKGINPMISKQVPYTVTKNVSFDVLTTAFYAFLRSQGMAMTAVSMFTIPLISAGLASVLSTVTSQPGDMVLSLVNAHKGDRRASEIFKSILNSPRGIGGFFVGFKTRLLHVGVTVTIQLLVYDYVKRLVGIAATGTC